MKTILTTFLLLLAFQGQVGLCAVTGLQCVRITNINEKQVNRTTALLLDFEEITCQAKLDLDKNYYHSGYLLHDKKELLIDKAFLKLDRQLIQIGTEIVLATDRRAKRAHPIIVSFLFYGILGGVITSTLVGIFLPPHDWNKPIKVIHPQESEFDRQTRLQEEKDAEWRKNRSPTIEELYGEFPIQAAPAKGSQQKESQCSAPAAKKIYFKDLVGVPGPSSLSASGDGDGAPTPPPNWNKEKPLPKIVPPEKPKKRKNNAPFLQPSKVARPGLRSPLVITISSDEDSEIEVIYEESPDIVQLQKAAEILIRMQPGTSLLTTSRVCDNLRPRPDRPGIAQVEQANLVLIPSSDEGTPISSPGSRGVPNVSFEAAVIMGLPETRAASVTSAHSIQNTHYTAEQWWRGLLWGSLASTYGNTCNMDSFFSHIVYLHRRYPAYFYNVMNLVDNVAENAIFEIIKIARNEVYGPRSRNRLIRENWISRFPNVFTNIISTGDVNTIDCVGGEGTNIFQQLANSSRMWLAHECNCDQASFQLNGYSVLRWTAESIRWLSNANTPAVRLSNHLTSLERLSCHQCLNSYRFSRGFVARSTWIHQFLIDSRPEQEPFNINFRYKRK